MSGATLLLKNGTYPLNMLENVVRLHLNHKANWNPLHLSLWRAYDHRAIPRVWHTLQQLKDMTPARPEKGK